MSRSDNNTNTAKIVGFSVLGGVVSILAFNIFQRWDRHDTFLHNMFVLSNPYVFPSIMNHHGNKPLKEQLRHLAKTTKKVELGFTSKFLTKYYLGEPLYSPSYGKDKTRVVEFTIPSHDDTDNPHDIPVICTCPSTNDNNNNDDHDIENVKKKKLPLIFYFHSGGLIMGSIHCELVLARLLAQLTNSVVCSIGYRKAPEFPYPIPIHDALDASLGILLEQPDQDSGNSNIITTTLEEKLNVGIDYTRVGTWGASAGGYMSAHVARRLTESAGLLSNKNTTTLKCQVSLIPMVKPHSGTKSMIQHWHAGVWSGPNNAYAWASYLPGDDGRLAADWKVSLLVDPSKDVIDKLPPAFIQIHTLDTLRDEGEMYANRLKEQGKLIELREYRTSHVGFIPGKFTDGGPADGSFLYAAKIMKDYLYK